MQTLKNLFYEYNSDGDLVDDHELVEARGKFMDLLRTVPQCSEELEELKRNLEDRFMAVGLQAEMQGFVRGFRYAMQIASDCGIGGAK